MLKKIVGILTNPFSGVEKSGYDWTADGYLIDL